MAGRRGQGWLTRSETLEIRRRVASGEAIGSIAADLGRTKRTIHRVIVRAGSIPPLATGRSPLRLSVAEREEISLGLRGGESFRRIATSLGRRTSTVSREVAANGGRRRYRDQAQSVSPGGIPRGDCGVADRAHRATARNAPPRDVRDHLRAVRAVRCVVLQQPVRLAAAIGLWQRGFDLRVGQPPREPRKVSSMAVGHAGSSGLSFSPQSAAFRWSPAGKPDVAALVFHVRPRRIRLLPVVSAI